MNRFIELTLGTLNSTTPTPAQYKTHGVMRVGANEWAYIV